MFESQLERWIVSQAGHDLPLAVVLPSGRRIEMAQPAKVEIRLKELSAVRYLLDPTLNNMGTAYVEGEIDLEGSVEDVIDGARQGEEVFAIEWRRVGLHQLIDQDPPLGVTIALDDLYLVDHLAVIGRPAAELLEHLKSLDSEFGLLQEQCSEPPIV